MRITFRTRNSLILEDTAAYLWLLGGFFIIIGGIVIWGLLGGFTNLNEITVRVRLFLWITSFVIVAAGIWVIIRNPRTKIIFDKAEDAVIINRSGLFGQKSEKHLFKEINNIDLMQSEDSEGDSVYMILLKFKNGEELKLSNIGFHSRELVLQTVEDINKFIFPGAQQIE